VSDQPQVLLAHRRPGQPRWLADYRATGGYQALGDALGRLSPAEVRQRVQDSGLRGRGGAGFPTGTKWSFFPADAPGPKYLVCNCDEMEPGTYKDRVLLEAEPHLLIEGMLLAAYALGVEHGYVFVRYAYQGVLEALTRATAEARAAGLLGPRVAGTGFAFELHLHGSAGRYILGEETSLLNGLEGVRPVPRLRPPFPAQRGLFGRPTTVQNVETLCCIPPIVRGGADWFRGLALTPGEAGTKLFGLSGHLNRTECFELPMGVPLREVVERHGGGVRQGRAFKACLPGGASTPYLTAQHLDLPMDFGSLERAGSRLGTAGVTVFDERTCMLEVTLNLTRFFARESCGLCTPCRDGLPYVIELMERLEQGRAGLEEIEILKAQPEYINHSFCALAVGAMGPVESLIRHFEEELREHVRRGGCPHRS
jgi:NADH-quinone oxidoreductase subunit F